MVTGGWWERFINRHPSLSLRTPAPLSYVRAMATDRESLERYFDLLQSILEENDIFDKATCIFNWMKPDFPSFLTGNTKNQITVLGCWLCTPSFCLLWGPKVIKITPRDSLLNYSVIGLVAIFFIMRPPPVQFCYFWMATNHTFALNFICQAAAEVIVFMLPPNTTYICQPLGKGPFSLLKSYWRNTVQGFTIKTNKALTIII